MKRSDVLDFIGRVIQYIQADDEETARTLFDRVYADLQPLFEIRQDLANIDQVIFFEIDEYLNNSEARRAGASSLGMLLSSYEEFLQEEADQIKRG